MQKCLSEDWMLSISNSHCGFHQFILKAQPHFSQICNGTFHAAGQSCAGFLLFLRNNKTSGNASRKSVAFHGWLVGGDRLSGVGRLLVYLM